MAVIARYDSEYLVDTESAAVPHRHRYTLEADVLIDRWRESGGLSSADRRGESVIPLIECDLHYSTEWVNRVHWSERLGYLTLPLFFIFLPLALLQSKRVAVVSFGRRLTVRQSDNGSDDAFNEFVHEVRQAIRRLQGDGPVQLTRVIG
jgi:hypothetical protein